MDGEDEANPEFLINNETFINNPEVSIGNNAFSVYLPTISEENGPYRLVICVHIFHVQLLQFYF